MKGTVMRDYDTQAERDAYAAGVQDGEAARDEKDDKALTLEDVKRMSVEECAQRLDEVNVVLAGGGSE
jgi:hypothetical protein